jgi:hypothetical protein
MKLQMLKHAEDLDQKYLAENKEYHQMEDMNDIMINLLHGNSLANYTYDNYYVLSKNGDFEFHLEVGVQPEDHADNPERKGPILSQKELALKIVDFGMEVKKKFPSREFDMNSITDKYEPDTILKELIFTIPKGSWQ